MTNDASVIEIVWTLLSGVGLVWCWWLHRDATRSRYYWEAEGLNGSTNIVTGANVRSSGVRTVKMGIYTIIGLTAMTLPPADYGDVHPAFIPYIIPLSFIAAAVLNVWDAVLSRRDRERLIAIERRRLRRVNEGGAS